MRILVFVVSKNSNSDVSVGTPGDDFPDPEGTE